ncbi:MAG: hypothetical protein GY847_05525 [Proteobacteria bacterium]|nr:hypothetical protein [Pseudomonadota bacterium]
MAKLLNRETSSSQAEAIPQKNIRKYFIPLSIAVLLLGSAAFVYSLKPNPPIECEYLKCEPFDADRNDKAFFWAAVWKTFHDRDPSIDEILAFGAPLEERINTIVDLGGTSGITIFGGAGPRVCLLAQDRYTPVGFFFQPVNSVTAKYSIVSMTAEYTGKPFDEILAIYDAELSDSEQRQIEGRLLSNCYEGFKEGTDTFRASMKYYGDSDKGE